jgi:hypothetical protein
MQSQIDEFIAQQKKDNEYELKKKREMVEEKMAMDTLNFLSVVQKYDDEMLDNIVFGILVHVQHAKNQKYSLYFVIETLYCLISDNIKGRKEIVERMKKIVGSSDRMNESKIGYRNTYENMRKCDSKILENFAKMFTQKIAERLEKQTFAMISTKNMIEENGTIEVTKF